MQVTVEEMLVEALRETIEEVVVVHTTTPEVMFVQTMIQEEEYYNV